MTRGLFSRLVLVGVLVASGVLHVSPQADAATGSVDLELSVSGQPRSTVGGLVNVIDWTVTLRNSTVSNTGISSASNLVVTDAVVTNIAATSTRQSASVTTGTYDNAGTWRIPALAAGAQATLTFRTTFALSFNSESATLSAQVTAQDQQDVDSTPAENTFVGDQDDEAVFRTGSATRYTVGDLVWSDQNGDGRYASPEPGVRGAIVIVTNTANGQTLFAGQTDENGKWSYPAVPRNAAVAVRFVPPGGAAFTTAKVGDDNADSDPSVATGLTAARTISANDLRIDAGLRLPADVSLTKSVTPASGAAPLTTTYTVRLTNAGPNPAAGVVVTDTLPAAATVSSAPTTAAGSVATATGSITWTIGQVAAGSTVTLTYGLRHSTVGAAVNRAQVTALATPDPDSVPNPAATECSAQTGQDDCATATVSVTPPPGYITGVVWHDANRDGQRQSTETLQAGVTIRLRNASDAVVSTTTTATGSGRYTFTGVSAGTYVVEVVAPSGAVFAVAGVGAEVTDSDVASSGRGTATVTGSTGVALDAGFVRADTPTDDPVLVPQGVSVMFNVLDNDAVPGRSAGAALPTGYAWARPSGPAWGAVSCNTSGLCTYRSLSNYAGLDSFTYTLINPSLGGATVTVSIQVLHVNDPPVARDDRAVGPPDQSISISVLGNDEDPNDPAVVGDPNRPGDPLRVTATGAVNPTSAGTASCSSNDCTFNPATGFTGVARFTYTVADSGVSDPRVANAGVPGGIVAVQPRTATATVTVYIDPARRSSAGFTGTTSVDGTVGSGIWSATTQASAAASCAATRPRISLSWTATAKATGYRVERIRGDNPDEGDWVVVATTDATVRAFVDDLVGEGTAMQYRITPMRGRWLGVASTVATVVAPSTINVVGC